jgi:hypothetical protein
MTDGYSVESISVLRGLERPRRRLGLEISLVDRTEVPLTGSYEHDLEHIFELYPEVCHLTLELTDGSRCHVRRDCFDLRKALREEVLEGIFNKNPELKAVHFPATAEQPAHSMERSKG